MGNDPTKKQNKEEVIQKNNPVEDGTTQDTANSDSTPSWMDIYAGTLSSAQDKYNKSVEAYNASVEARNTQRENARKARENGTSVLGTIFKNYKPKYDEDKEKRLAKRAMVQSLGDLLSAAVAGVYAYGKKGMGYVPTLPGGSHLKSLEEINRMKEEYRKANEAWKDFELKQAVANEEAKVAAEEALLKQYESDTKESYKAVEDARKAYDSLWNDFMKENIKAENKALDYEWKKADREDRQASTAALKALSKGQSSDLTKEGYIHALLTSDETYDEVTEVEEDVYNDETGLTEKKIKPRKTTKRKTYTLAEHNARGKYDAKVQKVKEYMKQGLSMEEAVKKVLAETKK